MTDLRLVPPPTPTPLTGDLGGVGFGWLNTAMLVAMGLFIGGVLAFAAVAILGASPSRPEPPVVVPNVTALDDMRRWADTLPPAYPPASVNALSSDMRRWLTVFSTLPAERPVAHRIAPRGIYRPAPRRVIIPEPRSGYIGCPPSVCSTRDHP
jgi:hypothetical protein